MASKIAIENSSTSGYRVMVQILRCGIQYFLLLAESRKSICQKPEAISQRLKH
jgi:hypothetical protein